MRKGNIVKGNGRRGEKEERKTEKVKEREAKGMWKDKEREVKGRKG